MLYEKMETNKQLHINYNAYLYNYVQSQDFRNLFISKNLEYEYVKDADIFYRKFRQSILIATYRFHNIFNINSTSNVTVVQDAARDYIIKFYSIIRSKDVANTVFTKFTTILIDGDDSITVYSNKELSDALSSTKYFSIKIIDSEGSVVEYQNMTILDALSTQLSGIMFDWTEQIQTMFYGFIPRYLNIYEDSAESKISKEYPSYVNQILDSFNSAIELCLNHVNLKYFKTITETPTKILKGSEYYTTQYTDLLNIITNNRDPETLKTLQSGEDLNKFEIDSIVNFKTLRDILSNISNIDANVTLNYDIKYIYSDNIIKSTLTEGYSEAKIIFKTSNKYYFPQFMKLTDIISNTIKSFLDSYKQALSDSIPQELYTINSTAINNILDEFINYIEQYVILNEEDYLTEITIDSIIDYIDNYNSTNLFRTVTNYSELVIANFKNNYNDIKNEFESKFSELGADVQYTVNAIDLFKIQISNYLSVFESKLTYMCKLLDLGYKVRNFNDNFKAFAIEFLKVIEPLLQINENATEVQLSELNELFNSFVTDILPIMYFQQFSNVQLDRFEFVTNPTFSNYTTNTPTTNSLLKTILIGNKALIYPAASINLISTNYINNILVDIPIVQNILYYVDMASTDKFIDFSTTSYFTQVDIDFSNICESLFNYTKNITLTSNKYSKYSISNIAFLPDYIYRKEGITIFNYSNFLKNSFGTGYYFQYDLVKYVSKQTLDNLTNRINNINSNISDYKYNVLVGKNLDISSIQYKSIIIDEFFETENFILPLKVKDILSSNNIDVALSLDYNYILTDNSPIKLQIIDFIENYKDYEFQRLTILDTTGVDFYTLSFMYKQYLSISAILNSNITTNILDLNLIQTYNVEYLNQQIKENPNINPVISRMLGKG